MLFYFEAAILYLEGMKCKMTQTLRSSRLKVIAEMTLSPALNGNIQQYGCMRNWLFMTPPHHPTPWPPPWHVLFANEYFRADNPAAFHTDSYHYILLIELRTCARVEAHYKQRNERFGGTRSIYFGLRDQENEVGVFLFCSFVFSTVRLTLEGIQRSADAYWSK